MFKKILIAFVAVIAVFAIVVALQPEDFRIERKAVVNAPGEVVFAQVNDFHSWQAWSPWAKLDPNSKTTFEGPAAGTGAIFRWDGNDEVGQGSMTITESKPNEYLRIKLDFLKPFEATNDTEFFFRPQGAGTEVAWVMSGKNNFLGRAMCMVMNMDAMLGAQFEKGLAQMKAIAEAPPAPAKSPAEPKPTATGEAPRALTPGEALKLEEKAK
ncbi:MAG: SRPBCC family protein [Planctomycetia bacterium]|nr:SRPBCC family protein [Planctomycetia bacterium]